MNFSFFFSVGKFCLTITIDAYLFEQYLEGIVMTNVTNKKVTVMILNLKKQYFFLQLYDGLCIEQW